MKSRLLGLIVAALVVAGSASADSPLDPMTEFVTAQNAALTPLGADGLPPGAHDAKLFSRLNLLALELVRPGQDARTILPLDPHSAVGVWTTAR
jgi:hypothetical protein